MTGRVFIDTNVLVHAFDRHEPEKSAAATATLAAVDDFAVSAQVLGEFYVTVTRKFQPPLPAAQADAAIAELARTAVVPTDVALVEAAIATARLAQISYWDALILEAAVRAGCERILTEDLNAGSTIHGVQIVNPFG